MIRAAVVADARAIGALQLRAWLRAYSDIVEGSVLAGYDVAGRERQWTEAIGGGDGSTTLVAEVAGRVSGFIRVGADRTEGAGPETGEVWALYVDPPAQGAGLGGHLLSAGEQLLRSDGFSSAILTVLEENGHARQFYERHGWSYAAGSDADHDWGAVEVMYEKAL